MISARRDSELHRKNYQRLHPGARTHEPQTQLLAQTLAILEHYQQIDRHPPKAWCLGEAHIPAKILDLWRRETNGGAK